jgi:glycerophosphoryl diester phosphodiesterase
MNTIYIQKNKAKMVAHRGVSGLEPENTNAAFIAAGNRSYYGIETDVHVTADGKYVVIHDDNTGRVSETNISIEDSTWEDLSKVRLYGNVAEKAAGRSDLAIPPLSDYIRICKHYDKVSVLELKNRIPTEHIRQIVQEIDSLGQLENTIFISFSWDNMIDLRAMLPDQSLQFLTGKWTDELPQLLKDNKLDLDIQFKQLTAERIQILHDYGITVNCWTVNDPQAAEELAAAGVDYITTNILE